MKKRHFLKRIAGPVLVLLAVAGTAVLGWALYGRGNDTAEEKSVTPGFYKEDAGAVHILENDYLLLSLDGDTTQFTLQNKQDGHVWRSIPEGADKDPLALAGSKNLLQSTLAITYSTDNGVRTLYDNHEYSIKNQIYEIHADSQAIRVDYTLGRIARAYTIPVVIEVGRMDSFLSQMTKAQSRKVLDSYRKYDPARLKDNQKTELLEKYPQLETDAIYVLRDNVKDFLKEEFESLFEAAGYTYEDYLTDQTETDRTVGAKTAVFNISVIYRLEGNDLIVEVPLDSIHYTDEYPPIRVALLPNFGAGGTMDEGYMLMPEGGGAIIRFNNGKIAQNSYFANVYGWDYATSRPAVVHETNVWFPVYGMVSNGSAFLCMMEDQAANVSLSADIAGRSNSFNTAYASYNLLHSDAFNVTERTIETIYMYEQSLPQGKITQRYRFLATSDVASLAQAYRGYLQERYPGLTPKSQTGLPLCVEIIGAIDKVQQKGGLPVSSPIRLTGYQDAAAIVSDLSTLGDTRLFVRLNGWMNGGVLQTLLRNDKLVSQLGTQEDFDNMVTAISDTGARLYLHGITSFAMDSGLKEGFLPLRDAARFTTREHVKLYQYSNIWYGELDLDDAYFLLKPETAADMLTNLARAARKRGASGISLEDIGSLLSADYNPRHTVTRDEVAALQMDVLRSQADGLGVMMRGGNLYALEHADLVTDTDLAGIGYFIVDEQVPFLQMALHGLVEYTGYPLNLAGDWEQELLLSAQRGAGLSFVFMQEEPLVLHDTLYSNYYGASYKLWSQRARQIASRYARELGGLFNQAIIGFEYLDDLITATTYADGTRVLVNFSQQERQAAGHTVPARDYLVVQGEVHP
ncbi:MAG TPA: DUF5696 domain-containing protein [Clostridia bacterium]|nr:DUF5696 domain-containing protein [Clostridia bacterium]HQO55801.1 DUF5696 domain-containing protein [Clostridia bacterium]